MAGNHHPNYKKIYFTLVILFIVSVLGPEIADIIGLQGVSRIAVVLITAFGIAIWKAYLVCAYFMHLKFEKIYAPYILLACLAMLFVFFFGSATEVMFPAGHNWVKDENVFSEDAATDEAKARSHVLHAGDAHGDAHGESHGGH